MCTVLRPQRTWAGMKQSSTKFLDKEVINKKDNCNFRTYGFIPWGIYKAQLFEDD